MATNPNAIFGEALATGPRQIPLSELQNQIAQTRQTQAQTANIGSQMAQRQQETIGLQQQNTLRQRQIDDEQAVRDTIAKHTTSVPVTAPNANIPTPGTDSDGNPLPLDLGYHQIAAKGAVQAPHVDYNGAYADLVGQGRFAAAETMLRSIQDRRAKDLENSKAQTALFETQNSRRNELAASVANAPPEQKAAVASQVGQQLEQEGLIAPGSGASFGPNEADVLYRSSAGAKDPIRAANAALGLTEAQAREVTAGARKTSAEAAMSEKELELMNRALSDPTAGTSSIDQLIDPQKYPDINSRTKAAFTSAMIFGGPKAAQQVLNSAVTHVNTLEEGISKETNPAVIKAKAQTAGAEEEARQNVVLKYLNSQGGTSQLAQDIANYKIPLNTALSNRIPLPARDAIIAEVNRINPNFNASNYAVKQKTEQDAVTGKIGTQRNALNTMMGHLDILDQAADALNNGNIQLLNRLANAVGAQTGATAKTTYETIVHRLGPEVTKAYLAGGGSVGERGTNEQDFSANLSPAQLKANVGVSAQLAASKIDALEDQYKSGTFGRGNLPSLLSPPAAAARQRLASQSPVGGPVTVTTKAAYDALPAGTPYIDSKGNRGVKGQK